MTDGKLNKKQRSAMDGGFGLRLQGLCPSMGHLLARSHHIDMVPRGLEPRTLWLLAIRSNQLSYETIENF